MIIDTRGEWGQKWPLTITQFRVVIQHKYINAGLYPNRDVTFIPGDYYYRPDTDSMRRIISTIAESFVQQYVYSGRI